MLRRDPPGGESWIPLALEYAVIERAAAGGVRGAGGRVAFEAAGGRFDTAGFLMEHVGGTSVAPRILRRDEYAAARRAGAGADGRTELARIHALDVDGLEGLRGGEADPALEACEFCEHELDAIGEPLPALEAGLRWLRLNAPEPVAPVLVHGDFRLGNLIVDSDGLAAVIDWELCHLGDPAEDLGWPLIRAWRFGSDELPVAGMGETEPFLDGVRGGGRHPAGRLSGCAGGRRWAMRSGP